jgi:energy-coupling factor transporter transmembrane protein EcfT
MIRQNVYRLNPLISLILFIGFLVVAYYVVINVLKFLYFSTPVLLLIAIIVDYKTVFQHIKSQWRKIINDPVMGILSVIVQVLALPFVCLWLIFMGFIQKKIRNSQAHFQKEEEYVEYEIIEENPPKIQP